MQILPLFISLPRAYQTSIRMSHYHGHTLLYAIFLSSDLNIAAKSRVYLLA